MGQGDLSRARETPAADQTGVADGVVGSPERPLADQRSLWGEQIRHAVNPGHLQRFLQRKAGEDAGERAGQQRLSGARGGPTIRRLWLPAAAISSARLACSWPLISAKSTAGGGSTQRSSGVGGAEGGSASARGDGR